MHRYQKKSTSAFCGNSAKKIMAGVIVILSVTLHIQDESEYETETPGTLYCNDGLLKLHP